MESVTGKVNHSEALEQQERLLAVRDLQITINEIMSRADKADRRRLGSQFTVPVETPFLPGTVWVGRDLDPSKEPHYGIEWEYEVNVGFPLTDTENGIPQFLDMYYFITPDDDVVRLAINEDDYITRTSAIDPERITDPFAFRDWIDSNIESFNRMDANIRIEIEQGVNGQPVPVDEIQTLTTILKNADIKIPDQQLTA